MARKTWQEKFNSKKDFEVKIIEKRFADMLEGTKMLIATPAIVDDYINQLPKGVFSNIQTLRNDLAITYNAEKTCPVTTGYIFANSK